MGYFFQSLGKPAHTPRPASVSGRVRTAALGWLSSRTTRVLNPSSVHLFALNFFPPAAQRRGDLDIAGNFIQMALEQADELFLLPAQGADLQLEVHDPQQQKSRGDAQDGCFHDSPLSSFRGVLPQAACMVPQAFRPLAGGGGSVTMSPAVSISLNGLSHGTGKSVTTFSAHEIKPTVLHGRAGRTVTA